MSIYKKLSVIIPVYNEEAILPQTKEQLTHALMALTSCAIIEDYEILFSNDGSTDKSAALLDTFAKEDPHIRPCGYPQNHGKGCAVRTAILASTGDVVLYTDCDLAYGTDVFAPALQALSSSGADILIGSRPLHPDGYAGYPLLRRLASHLYLQVLSVFAGFRYSDSQCGFKVLSGDTARTLFSRCQTDGFAFDLEMLLRAQRANISITEFPIKILDHARASKVRLVSDSLRMLSDISDIKKLLHREDAPKTEFSLEKKRIPLLLLFPFLALILELLPYGAVLQFAQAPGSEAPYLRQTYSYFDLTPFGYANFSPLLTAIITCLICGFALLTICCKRKKWAVKAVFGTACAAFVLSLCPFLLGLRYVSVTGTGISVCLFGTILYTRYLLRR